MDRALTLSSLTLVLALAAIGCAHGGGGVQPAAASGPPPSERACFMVREVRSYDAFDDRHVAIETIRDESYLLTLDNVCFGLDSAIRIAISNDFNRVCSDDLAVITYRDYNRLDTCRILNVERVADHEAALELWRSRLHR